MYLGATSETSLSFCSALHYTMPSLSTLIMLSKRRNSKLPTGLAFRQRAPLARLSTRSLGCEGTRRGGPHTADALFLYLELLEQATDAVHILICENSVLGVLAITMDVWSLLLLRRLRPLFGLCKAKFSPT